MPWLEGFAFAVLIAAVYFLFEYARQKRGGRDPFSC